MLPTKDVHIGKAAVKSGMISMQELEKAKKIALRTHPPALLGRVLVELGYINSDEMLALSKHMHEYFKKKKPFWMEKFKDREFANLLVSQSAVTEDSISKARRIQNSREFEEQKFYRLWKILVENGDLEYEAVQKLVQAQNTVVLTCLYCETQFDSRKYKNGARVVCRQCGCVLVEGKEVENPRVDGKVEKYPGQGAKRNSERTRIVTKEIADRGARPQGKVTDSGVTAINLDFAELDRMMDETSDSFEELSDAVLEPVSTSATLDDEEFTPPGIDESDDPESDVSDIQYAVAVEDEDEASAKTDKILVYNEIFTKAATKKPRFGVARRIAEQRGLVKKIGQRSKG
ncbi:MAG: hypothetical protein NUW37_01000 [Planctomycetes bacterium]|nr:hypothetical protein [Planctomycetota bacterium]